VSSDTTSIPFFALFYKVDKNLLASFAQEYGLIHIVSVAGTYGIIKSDLDWKWFRFSVENKAISNSGFVSVALGGLVPLAVPLGCYWWGKSQDDTRLQITGLALGQSVLISIAISSIYKALTARRPPDESNALSTDPNYSDDFKFGFLNRGAFEGWPSSHTMNAFAMAATMIELYPDNTPIAIISLTYASIVGLGVSTNIHWFSDAFAGALIGYSIGSVVGREFSGLIDKKASESALKFYFTPTRVGIAYTF
jgi:membrane-associated phospholipid phosphatase